jgi:hypothetical protein
MTPLEVQQQQQQQQRNYNTTGRATISFLSWILMFFASYMIVDAFSSRSPSSSSYNSEYFLKSGEYKQSSSSWTSLSFISTRTAIQSNHEDRLNEQDGISSYPQSSYNRILNQSQSSSSSTVNLHQPYINTLSYPHNYYGSAKEETTTTRKRVRQTEVIMPPGVPADLRKNATPLTMISDSPVIKNTIPDTTSYTNNSIRRNDDWNKTDDSIVIIPVVPLQRYQLSQQQQKQQSVSDIVKQIEEDLVVTENNTTNKKQVRGSYPFAGEFSRDFYEQKTK